MPGEGESQEVYFKTEKNQTSKTIIRLDDGFNYLMSDAEPKI